MTGYRVVCEICSTSESPSLLIVYEDGTYKIVCRHYKEGGKGEEGKCVYRPPATRCFWIKGLGKPRN